MTSNRKALTVFLWLLLGELSLGFLSAQGITPQDLYKKSLPSIMTLQVQKKDGSASLGTGFLAMKEGLAVTAWHVVRDAKAVSVKFSDGEEYEASGLVDKDEKRDVVIIRVKIFGRPLLSLASLEPEVGNKVFAIGAPKGLEFSISDGILSQKQTIEGVKLFQFTSPVSPGNSGGPLLSNTGEVLGIVTSQIQEGQNLNFAIPANFARALDVTLPTQPWESVKPGTTISNKFYSDEEADRSFAKCLLCMLDLYTAIALAEQDVTTREEGFKNGVPSTTYSSIREAEENKASLEAMLCANPERSRAREAFLKDMSHLLEAANLLVEAIRVAGRQRGWDANANDLASRSAAARDLNREVSNEVLQTLARSTTFAGLLPEDVKVRYGLASDSAGFHLGVLGWASDPLKLLVVDKRSFAHELGFRRYDLILTVEGRKPRSLQEVKVVMKKSVGKTISVVVRRFVFPEWDTFYDQPVEKELDIDVPEKLPGND